MTTNAEYTQSDSDELDEDGIFTLAALASWIRAILSRPDLTISEIKMVLRQLLCAFSTRSQRKKIWKYLECRNLLWQDNDTADDVTRRLTESNLKATIERSFNAVDIDANDTLLGIWSLYFVTARPGTPIPRLETIDADLPYVAPSGVGDADPAFAPGRILGEIAARERFGPDICFRMRP